MFYSWLINSRSCVWLSESKSYIGLFLVGQIHFDDINLDKDYDPSKSYRQSKLANVLFGRELAARLQGSVWCTLCTVNTVWL